MTTRFDSEARKYYRPRVEADTIGTLDVDDMREGVVWSGRLEYTSVGELENDPSDDDWYDMDGGVT
jgi:hypothetical protein